MESHHPEIIIIKRKGGHGEGHHGGAWKIAFADFMTAMMAFFLVLWIINATDKDTKTVIARYFNPVKLENPAKAKKGVHGADASTKIDTDETTGDQSPGAPPSPSATPAKESKDVKEGKKDSKEAKDVKDGKEGKDAKAAAEPALGPAPPKKDDKLKGQSLRPEPPEPVDVKPSASETALFSDPYQALDQIAGGRAALSPAPPPDTGAGEATREAGAASINAFRDPFKPIGPGSVNDPVSFDSDVVTPAMPSQKPDLEPQRAAEPTMREGKTMEAARPDRVSTETPALAEAVAAAGSQARDAKAASETPDSERNHFGDVAASMLRELQQKLGPLSNSVSSPVLDVKSTGDGLLISLTDRLTFSMFAIGSAEPRAEVIKAMDVIARALKGRPGQIVLRGHTDARPYKSQTYDNWRLSSARAQMAYYMLVRGGVPESRIERVEGHADRSPFDPAHPLAPENRRLEILLREAKP